MATFLAETTSVEEAIAEERASPPGVYEIRFYTPEPPIMEKLQDIFDHLHYNGVDVKRVYPGKKGGLYYIGVIYRKPRPSANIGWLPVAIIPLIALGFISVLIGIGIFKVTDIASALGKLALVTLGGTIVIVALLRKPIVRAAEALPRR